MLSRPKLSTEIPFFQQGGLRVFWAPSELSQASVQPERAVPLLSLLRRGRNREMLAPKDGNKMSWVTLHVFSDRLYYFSYYLQLCAKQWLFSEMWHFLKPGIT